jgi:hypothetical protein
MKGKENVFEPAFQPRPIFSLLSFARARSSAAECISPSKHGKITHKKAATTAQLQPYFQLSLFVHNGNFLCFCLRMKSEMDHRHTLRTMPIVLALFVTFHSLTL